MPERRKPLAGIRVLDLTRLLPGPMATLHLADMGADVIKIEDTEAGDYSRSMGRVRGVPLMSDFFRLVNRNKRAIRLDLKNPKGCEVFLRLAKKADVVVTDAVFAHAIFPPLGFLEHGRTPHRGSGMLDGGLPCYNVYRARDGRWMAVGALERKFWETLCDILECPELKGKHIVYGEEARPVKERLAAAFASRTE